MTFFKRSSFMLLCAGSLLACAPKASVTRRHADRVSEGRYIPARAYAYYTRALRFEAHGKRELAEAAFRGAFSADPQSAAAAAGVTRNLCSTSREKSLKFASSSIEQVDRPALVHVALANCLLTTKQTQPNTAEDQNTAQEHFQLALQQEPSLPSATLGLSQLLQSQGKSLQAERYLRALQLWNESQGAPALETSFNQPKELSQLELIDRALWKGSLAEARQLAGAALTPGELSARAFAWDLRKIAKTQAVFALALNPRDSEAQFVKLLLTHPEPLSLSELTQLVAVVETAEQLSELSQLLLIAELSRLDATIGSRLRQEWLESSTMTSPNPSAQQPSPETTVRDRLLENLREYLSAAP